MAHPNGSLSKEPHPHAKTAMTNAHRRTSSSDNDVAGDQPENIQTSITSQISLDSTERIDSTRSLAKSRKSRLARTLCWVLFSLIVSFLIVDLIVIPGWFYTCPWIRHKCVYWSFWRHKPDTPAAYGFHSGYSYSISSERDVALGVWYLPQNHSNAQPQPIQDDEKSVILLYLHGNKGDRTSYHCVNMYRVLNGMNLSVVTFDYRGYGESSGKPSAEGFVRDALAIYRSIRTKIPSQQIVIWGHSMGTWVANRLLGELSHIGDLPAGLVLEAPFDHIANAFGTHIFTSPLHLLPCFDQVYVDSLKNDPVTDLDSSKAVAKIDPSIPVLILHAKDDRVVPFELGVSLYETLLRYRFEQMFSTTHIIGQQNNTVSGGTGDRPESKESGSNEVLDAIAVGAPLIPHNVTFNAFDSALGYGHTRLYTSPALPAIVSQFVRESIVESGI